MPIVLANAQAQQVAYVAAVAPLPSTGQAVSGSAWIYPRKMTPPGRQAIFTLEGAVVAAPALSFEINTSGPGSLAVVRGNPASPDPAPLRLVGTPNVLGFGVPVRNRGWHHVAFTYDGGVNTSGIRLFVDGVEVTTFSSIDEEGLPPPPAGTGQITVGAFGGSAGLDGAIGDVGLWYGRVLSEAEVLSLADGSTTPRTLGGTGLVFAPQFAADLRDPVSGVVGAASPGVVAEPLAAPRVRAGLIALYDARTGLANSETGLTWRDASGGGNTLIQSSGGNQPGFMFVGSPSGLPAIAFDPYLISYLGGKWMTTQSAANADLPSDAFTVAYVGSVRLPAGSGAGAGQKFMQCVFSSPQFALRIGGPTGNALRDGELAYTDALNPGGVFAGNAVRPLSSPGFLAWRGNGAGTIDFTSMDRAASAARAASPAASGTSWRIGAAMSGNVNGFLGNAHQVMVYNRRLSDSELSVLRASVSSLYSMPLSPRRVVAVEGSSSAAGYNAYVNREYAYRSANERHDFGYNFARGGDDVSSNGAADIRTQAAQGVDTVVRPGLANVLMVQIGSNDLFSLPAGNDATRAQNVFNNIKQYCLARRAAGYTRIGVITILSRNAAGTPAGQAAFDNRRRLLNDLLRQNAGGAAGYDEVIDFAAHPQIGADSAFSLYPWLYSDNTHLSDEGFNAVEPYLEAFLASPQPRVLDAEPLIVR